MKERIQSLNLYPKLALLLTCLMALLFTVLYPVLGSGEGFVYEDTLLTARQEDGGTVYAGTIDGVQVSFTVSEENTVVYRYGERSYGPYTVQEDASAIPEGMESQSMTGFELRCGDEVVFRGDMRTLEPGVTFLYNEDGELSVTFGTDELEPDLSTLLTLMDNPTLSHRGSWLFWGLGILCCAAEAVFVLYADELYRFALSFRTRNAEEAEPSTWEWVRRYLTWTFYPVFALIVFVQGLNVYS